MYLLWNHIVPIFDLIPCPTYHHGKFLIWRANLDARVNSTPLPSLNVLMDNRMTTSGNFSLTSAELLTLYYFDAF